MGKTPDEWTYGDLDAGFKSAALVLDETFLTPNTSHQTLEPRTAMAYWQNGKLYIHCSTQSVVQTVGSVSRWLRLDPKDVVVISQYTGGGFGSKATGTITSMIPALLSKKLNAPVMMRIDRETEHYIGGARPAVYGRLKVGFAKDGRITALDMFVINENGPYEPQGDTGMTGRTVSLLYQPPAMRWRGVSVLTNTPPRRAQSQPGGMQGIVVIEPILAKAARKLGVDRWRSTASTRRKARRSSARSNPRGERAYATSAFVKETLDRGEELFEWEERKAQGGKRQGSKVRGYGVATSAFVAGSTGYDGLFVIKPDGRLSIQSGIGNLGTESMSDCHRVSAEMLGIPWEKVDLTWGHTGKNLPWSCVSGGSQTTHAHTRAAHAAATDAIKKLQEIAAKVARRQARAVHRRQRARLRPRRQHDARAGGAESDRARRQVRRPRSARGHQRVHEGVGGGARGPGADGRRARHVSARRRDPFLRRRVRRSRGRPRDRQVPHRRLPRGRRRRHRHPSALARRPGARPIDARHRPRHRPALGVRPAVRAAGREAVLPEQAADDSRRAAEDGVGCA